MPEEISLEQGGNSMDLFLFSLEMPDENMNKRKRRHIINCHCYPKSADNRKIFNLRS